MNFIEDIQINITSYLQSRRDNAIRSILDILDMSDIDIEHKKKLRKVVLDELNEQYTAACRVLTYIQEQNGIQSNKK